MVRAGKGMDRCGNGYNDPIFAAPSLLTSAHQSAHRNTVESNMRRNETRNNNNNNSKSPITEKTKDRP
jgi:hypothetical protein